MTRYEVDVIDVMNRIRELVIELYDDKRFSVYWDKSFKIQKFGNNDRSVTQVMEPSNKTDFTFTMYLEEMSLKAGDIDTPNEHMTNSLLYNNNYFPATLIKEMYLYSISHRENMMVNNSSFVPMGLLDNLFVFWNNLRVFLESELEKTKIETIDVSEVTWRSLDRDLKPDFESSSYLADDTKAGLKTEIIDTVEAIQSFLSYNPDYKIYWDQDFSINELSKRMKHYNIDQKIRGVKDFTFSQYIEEQALKIGGIKTNNMSVTPIGYKTRDYFPTALKDKTYHYSHDYRSNFNITTDRKIPVGSLEDLLEYWSSLHRMVNTKYNELNIDVAETRWRAEDDQARLTPSEFPGPPIIKAININILNGSFQDDKYGIYYSGLNHYDTMRKIRNVQNKKLSRIVRELPDDTIEEQFAYWHRAMVGLQLFPDGNNRTSMSTFLKALSKIGYTIDYTPNEAKTLTEHMKNFMRIKKVNMGALHEHDKMYNYALSWIGDRVATKHHPSAETLPDSRPLASKFASTQTTLPSTYNKDIGEQPIYSFHGMDTYSAIGLDPETEQAMDIDYKQSRRLMKLGTVDYTRRYYDGTTETEVYDSLKFGLYGKNNKPIFGEVTITWEHIGNAYVFRMFIPVKAWPLLLEFHDLFEDLSEYNKMSKHKSIEILKRYGFLIHSTTKNAEKWLNDDKGAYQRMWDNTDPPPDDYFPAYEDEKLSEKHMQASELSLNWYKTGTHSETFTGGMSIIYNPNKHSKQTYRHGYPGISLFSDGLYLLHLDSEFLYDIARLSLRKKPGKREVIGLLKKHGFKRRVYKTGSNIKFYGTDDEPPELLTKRNVMIGILIGALAYFLTKAVK